MVRPPTARRLAFLQREDGQDALEYMLIIGGVALATVVAIGVLAIGVPGIRSATCGAISTVLTGYSGCDSGGGSGSAVPAGGGTAGASGNPPGFVQPTGTPSLQCTPTSAPGSRNCFGP
jgi:Flp pilus assembly pilin Flp